MRWHRIHIKVRELFKAQVNREAQGIESMDSFWRKLQLEAFSLLKLMLVIMLMGNCVQSVLQHWNALDRVLTRPI